MYIGYRTYGGDPPVNIVPIKGLHPFVKTPFCSLRGYVTFFNLIYLLFFSIHMSYVGGSAFNHLTVIHLVAVVSKICRRYFWALPLMPFGNRPSRATG